MVKGIGFPNDQEVLDEIATVQGGAVTVQDLQDEFDAQLDLAEARESSGSLLMTGAEQTLYDQSSDHPFFFAGGFIDFTSCFPNIEAYVIKVKYDIDGTNARIVWQQTFTGGGNVPSNDTCGVPSPDPTAEDQGIPQGFYSNGNQVQVTIQQTVESDGYNTIEFSFPDAQR